MRIRIIALIFGILIESGCRYSATSSDIPELLINGGLQTNPFYSKFLFAMSIGDTAVRSFSLDYSSGQLTQTDSINTGISGLWISRHPIGPFLFVTENAPNDGVHSISWDRDTGALAAINNITTGINNSHRVFPLPDGSAVLFSSLQPLTNYNYATVDSQGTLGTPSVKASLSNNTQGMALHPSGRFLFTGNSAINGIETFSVAPDGTMSDLVNTPFATGEMLQLADFDSQGKFLFVLSAPGLNNRLVSYQINEATGALTEITNMSTGLFGAVDLAVHPDNKRLYVSDSGTGSITEYAIGTDGSLSPVRQNPTGSGSFDSMCMDASGKFIFQIELVASATIRTVQINDDGTLTAVSTFSGGNIYRHCTVSLDSR